MSLLDTLLEDELLLPPPLVAGVVQREIWICKRTDGGSQAIFGDGTADNPYDGSTADKFDAVMGTIVRAGASVRIGPGDFETRGGQGSGWSAKNGRIVGSGMFVTTLKLVDVATAGSNIAVVKSTSALDFFEISDLTLDANIAGQPNSPKPGGGTYDYARVCVEGIFIEGCNIAVRRVRIINAGTQTPNYEYNTATPVSWECFSLGVTSNGPGNIVEDCILEQYGANNAREVTCLAVGAGGDSGQQLYYQTVVRNCLVNLQSGGRTLRTLAVKSATPPGASPTVVFEFWEDHDKTVNDFVLISGVTIQTSPLSVTDQNPYNGYFKVTGVAGKTLTVTLLANSNDVSGSLVFIGAHGSTNSGHHSRRWAQ
jgi:hypothetical protein